MELVRLPRAHTRREQSKPPASHGVVKARVLVPPCRHLARGEARAPKFERARGRVEHERTAHLGLQLVELQLRGLVRIVEIEIDGREADKLVIADKGGHARARRATAEQGNARTA